MRPECVRTISEQGENMKRLIVFVLSLASIGFVASSAEAKAAELSMSPAAVISTSAVAPQRRGDWRGRRARVVTRTRLVRSGRRVYRETYQIRYMPNGRTVTRLISRVRIR